MSVGRRDLGLDALRAIALLLMASIHYFQRLPSPTPLTELLNFVGESSAAFFFFSFGLTFDRYRSKGSGERLASNLMFLCVALAHNLFLWDKLAIVDFLCFLFLWRIILDASTSLQRAHLAWLGLAAGVVLLALLLPEKGMIDRVFMKLIGGLFPLLPWGVFVLLGAAYARIQPSKGIAFALGLAGVALALLFGWLGVTTGRTSFQVSKWPLTAPYLLFFTGINVLILEAVRAAEGQLQRWPRLTAPLIGISSNLLLLTVLQYLPLELLYWIGPRLSILSPGERDLSAVLAAIAVGSLASVLLLLGLLPLVTAGWDRIRDLRLLVWLRANRSLSAVTLLTLTGLLCTKPARDLLAGELLARPGKPLAAALMIYFALELREWQRRGRQRPAGGGRVAALAVGALILALCACAPAAEPRSPNVLLVTIDTLRADHLGCYGYPKPTSPHLDRLCEESAVFETALTPTPTTAPGHASILTGLHPATHGVQLNGWKLSGAFETLAELLHARGYRTHAVVSVEHLSTRHGFGQGFDRLDSELDGALSLDPRRVTDKAVAWIASSPEEPFFLWLHYWDPHAPYSPPPDHDIFAPPGVEGARFYDSQDPDASGGIDTRTRVGLERAISLYDGEIHYVDSELGRVFEALATAGLYDESLTIVSSDHGEMLDELASSHDYRFDHGEYLFDGNVRVPLIIRLPGARAAGTVLASQVSTLDIVPTILDYVGATAAERLDGASLLPVIEGREPEASLLYLQRKAALKSDLPRYHEVAVRSDAWKLVADFDSGSLLLYDMTRPDGEQADLLEAHVEEAAPLRDALKQWVELREEARRQEIPDEDAAALRALGYAQ